MALTETYLELAPEFGGTRFGPFKAMEIRLGSDPGSNDIVLPENLGVLPNHVKLLAQGDGSFIVAPVERTAGVFSYRSGGSAKQVTSPIAIQGGSDAYSADSFALVTPEGPRFYVLLVQARAEGKKKETDFDRAKKRLSGGSLLNEIKRQGLVMFLTTRGGAEIQRWGTFIKTGAILRPRFLISGVAILAGWLFAGGLGLVACQAAVGNAKAKQDLETCKVEKAVLGGDDSSGPTIEVHVARVLGAQGAPNNAWKTALRQDTDFADAFRKELGAILLNEDRKDRLRWVYRRPDGDFAKVKREMDNAKWPPELVRVFAYTAALEGTGTDREWTFLESDSMGKTACARGPLAITWRQGQQLGLPDLSLDAAVPYAKWSGAIDAERAGLLKDTASTLLGFTPPDDVGKVHGLAAINQQDIMCAYNGEEDASLDPRSLANTKELVAALGKSVGPSARGVPSVENAVGVLSRLLKFYAADDKMDIGRIDLSNANIPSIILNEAKTVKPYAMQKAAETLAKAVAIPCMARLDPSFADLKLDRTIGQAPEPLDCIIIEGMIKYNVK
jgi:hypothetical protein